MPDLNLLDDVSFEEESAPAPKAPKVKRPSSSGGGGGKFVLVFLIVILLLGVTVYFLNQRGILKLWGKKQPIVTQVIEEPFPPMVQEQPPAPHPRTPSADSAQLALLDTTGTTVSETTIESGTPESRTEISLPGMTELGAMEGEYTVQVIAFKERRRAEEVRANLEEAGYPAFVEQIPMKNGLWYRVCVGKYPTREDARKAVHSFGSQLQTSYIIDKISKQ